MKKLEQFLNANRVIFVILAILILPFVLVWSLIYGLIIGIIGGAVDCFENTRDVVKRVRWETLKYSNWSGLEYQKSQGNVPSIPQEKEFLEKAIRNGRFKTPGIGVRIFGQYLLGICSFPFLLVWGAVTGPIRAWLLFIDWCQKVWKGKTA